MGKEQEVWVEKGREPMGVRLARAKAQDPHRPAASRAKRHRQEGEGRPAHDFVDPAKA